jgi:hypothetical protein
MRSWNGGGGNWPARLERGAGNRHSGPAKEFAKVNGRELVATKTSKKIQTQKFDTKPVQPERLENYIFVNSKKQIKYFKKELFNIFEKNLYVFTRNSMVIDES